MQTISWDEVPLIDAREWQDTAACRDVPDPDVFFPGRGEGVDDARLICAGCPVQDACLDWAIKNETYGVWGGLSTDERLRLRGKVYRVRKRLNQLEEKKRHIEQELQQCQEALGKAVDDSLAEEEISSRSSEKVLVSNS